MNTSKILHHPAARLDASRTALVSDQSGICTGTASSVGKVAVCCCRGCVVSLNEFMKTSDELPGLFGNLGINGSAHAREQVANGLHGSFQSHTQLPAQWGSRPNVADLEAAQARPEVHQQWLVTGTQA